MWLTCQLVLSCVCACGAGKPLPLLPDLLGSWVSPMKGRWFQRDLPYSWDFFIGGWGMGFVGAVLCRYSFISTDFLVRACNCCSPRRSHLRASRCRLGSLQQEQAVQHTYELCPLPLL